MRPVTTPLQTTDHFPTYTPPSPTIQVTKVPQISIADPVHRAGESMMRSLLHDTIQRASSNWTTIQSPYSSVKFEALSAADTRDEVNYLSKMHEEWLTSSPSYARLVAEATSDGRSVRVQINNEYELGARVEWDDETKEHFIEINPSVGLEFGSDGPLNDYERRSMICVCLLFELQNAASMNEMATFFGRANAGEFENKPDMLNRPEIEKKIMRHDDDRCATHYAFAVEHQEFKNTQDILKVIDELREKGNAGIIDDHRESFLWDSFDEYLDTQIDNGHTQSYLDMYDSLAVEKPM